MRKYNVTLSLFTAVLAVALGLAGCAAPQSPTQSTQSPTSTSQQAPAAQAPATTSQQQAPATTSQQQAPQLDTTVQAAGVEAVQAVDTMHSELSLEVLLYATTGPSVSAAEATALSEQADITTAATTVVVSYINQGAYDSHQLSHLSEMGTAGSKIATHIGLLNSDTAVQTDFSDFDEAYTNFQDAS